MDILQFQDVLAALLSMLNSNVFLVDVAAQAADSGNKYLFGIDMSIEGLRSKQYSYFIFVFLILSLVLFSYIIYLYLPKGKKSLKTGEKVMFAALILGMVAAIAIGWIQLIEGYLL